MLLMSLNFKTNMLPLECHEELLYINSAFLYLCWLAHLEYHIHFLCNFSTMWEPGWWEELKKCHMSTRCAYLRKTQEHRTGTLQDLREKRDLVYPTWPYGEFNLGPALAQMSLLNLLSLGRHFWRPMSYPLGLPPIPATAVLNSVIPSTHTCAIRSLEASGAHVAQVSSLNQQGQKPASCLLDSQCREAAPQESR